MSTQTCLKEYDASEYLKLLREDRIIQAILHFWQFCKLLHGDFYREDRPHLRKLCETLQALYEHKLIKEDGTPYMKLMMNIPPRHGKTRTLVLFCAWILGLNMQNRIIACSFNDDAAYDFSRYTRDTIEERKTYPEDIVYRDIFPATQIKRGHASLEKWAIEGQFFSYKGAGIGGSITGKGGTVILEDDLVKDVKVAFNEFALDKIWEWRIGTLLSRKEEGALEILDMSRWAKKDPCGRIHASDMIKDWYVLKMEAYDEKTDKMLCPALLSKESYLNNKKEMDASIFRANYHQEPIDIRGKLYSELKTYKKVPVDDEGNVCFQRIINYTDSADEGSDYLCSVTAGVFEGEGWILEVYITKEGMEITEPGIAKFLMLQPVSLAKFESNAGGRGFARAIQRIISEKVAEESKRVEDEKSAFTEDDRAWRKIGIKWFHQTENKRARILTNSNFIMQHIYFPHNWKDRWPIFFREINEYQREGKNKNDDAPDTLTGIAEMINTSRPRARLIS